MRAATNVSVAMTTWNGAEHLQAQLESLAAQNTLPSELVVCDDASQDNTLSILESFQSGAPFPTYIFRNMSRVGVVRNFEQAISQCKGEIIALCDQDDVWYPNKLTLTIEALSTHLNPGLVFTDADIVDENLQPLGYRLWEAIHFTSRRQQMVKDDRALQALLKRDTVNGASLAFHSFLIPTILPIPDESMHDAWIALITSALRPLAIVPQPTLAYRQHTRQQIGGRRKDLAMRLAKANQADASKYQRQERILQHAIDRLALREPTLRITAALALLEQKQSHFQARANFPISRLSRLRPALAELIRLRYHRYSNGLASFATDLILRRE